MSFDNNEKKDPITEETDQPDISFGNCTICLEPLYKKEHRMFLPCAHHYHNDCIRQFLKTHTVCPNCKVSIYVKIDEHNPENIPAEFMNPADSRSMAEVIREQQEQQDALDQIQGVHRNHFTYSGNFDYEDYETPSSYPDLSYMTRHVVSSLFASQDLPNHIPEFGPNASIADIDNGIEILTDMMRLINSMPQNNDNNVPDLEHEPARAHNDAHNDVPVLVMDRDESSDSSESED